MMSDTETLFIPVIFGNRHWCAVIVDVKGNEVMYYDFMNQRSYKSVLDRLWWDLAETFERWLPGDRYQLANPDRRPLLWLLRDAQVLALHRQKCVVGVNPEWTHAAAVPHPAASAQG
ncbi:hypothetical protein F442_16219 [Phytophthora nicotianae P10297]|uniref:Ubiquitin-like protease family profile domain-containing protein n=1 Tax=Phytophthora nicotianae P10297 TaxID=1317064 RepID=W2YKY5_PHYNI|nr:hypothetical protein F442_16219 [Phytophthora nicotianae P10297]